MESKSPRCCVYRVHGQVTRKPPDQTWGIVQHSGDGQNSLVRIMTTFFRPDGEQMRMLLPKMSELRLYLRCGSPLANPVPRGAMQQCGDDAGATISQRRKRAHTPLSAGRGLLARPDNMRYASHECCQAHSGASNMQQCRPICVCYLIWSQCACAWAKPSTPPPAGAPTTWTWLSSHAEQRGPSSHPWSYPGPKAATQRPTSSTLHRLGPGQG